MSFLTLIADRAREPSTWASIAAVLGMAGVNVDPGVWHTVALFGAAGAAALGVVLSEKGSKNGMQIAEDALNALAANVNKPGVGA